MRVHVWGSGGGGKRRTGTETERNKKQGKDREEVSKKAGRKGRRSGRSLRTGNYLKTLWNFKRRDQREEKHLTNFINI